MDSRPFTPTELVDPAAIARIMEFAELDPTLPAEVVELFLSSTEEDLLGLAIAAEAGDPEGVERTAHRMCSSAAGAGATALGALCLTLCEGARKGERCAPNAAEGVRRMRDAFAVQLRVALGLC